MGFADLKNDFVFQRIVAMHPDVLLGRLNELANQAKLTRTELDTYQRVMDEIQQVTKIAEARWAQGRAAGVAEGKVAGVAEGKVAGKVAGLVAAVMAVLTARGLLISTAVRARIEEEKDLETLNQWVARAATAPSAEDVIGP